MPACKHRNDSMNKGIPSTHIPHRVRCACGARMGASGQASAHRPTDIMRTSYPSHACTCMHADEHCSLRICMHARMYNACMDCCMHACMLTYAPACMCAYAYAHASVHASAHACIIGGRMRRCVHAFMRSCVHAFMRALKHYSLKYRAPHAMQDMRGRYSLHAVGALLALAYNLGCVQTCMHAYVSACMRAWVHACIRVRSPACVYTGSLACAAAVWRQCVYVYACLRASMRACMHRCIGA
jgi:hypothetical protein